MPAGADVGAAALVISSVSFVGVAAVVGPASGGEADGDRRWISWFGGSGQQQHCTYPMATFNGYSTHSPRLARGFCLLALGVGQETYHRAHGVLVKRIEPNAQDTRKDADADGIGWHHRLAVLLGTRSPVERGDAIVDARLELRKLVEAVRRDVGRGDSELQDIQSVSREQTAFALSSSPDTRGTRGDCGGN